MATNNNKYKITITMGSLEDLLMCSVCIERYHEKDRQPVLLPRCGHSFCRNCVAMLVTSGCIVCPACRTDQRIESIDKLPTEYTLLAIINEQENYKKETCQLHQVKLSFWCTTCGKAACGECLFEDHPTHKHDIVRSVKYIADKKQNATDITTRFFDSLSKKEEELHKLIFECTTNISWAFKNITSLRNDAEEARELMKSINQDATISSATALHETAKFLGLKWNIQDANSITNITDTNNRSVNNDPDDEISREKAKIKADARLKEEKEIEERKIKENEKNDKDEHEKLETSKTIPSVDILNLPEKNEQESINKSKLKPSKTDDLSELEQIEKDLEESIKKQEALTAELKKGESKITKESSNKKEKTSKKITKKRFSVTPTDEKIKIEDLNKPNKINGQYISSKETDTSLNANTLSNDEESTHNEKKEEINNINGQNDNSDINTNVSFYKNIEEKDKDSTNDNGPNNLEIINADSGLSQDSKSINIPKLDVVNQSSAKISDCIQVPGFMICVEGQNGRLGQITWGSQGLHVHALQFQQIDYDIVISAALFGLLTPTISPAIFLELSADQDLLGRVYIRLWGNLRRASNFLSLCLGHEGNSYLNTKFLQVYNVASPGERVLGGDYEYNTGKGGRGVIDNLEWNDHYSMPMKAGMITAAGSGQTANNSLFLICTQSDPSRNFCCPFGIVFEGMKVLKEAVKLTPIKQVYISDCGALIIPPGMNKL